MSENISLNLDGKTLELPVIEGSEREKALDISKLRSQTGYITYDNGYGNTGSCLSAITYIDGERGILSHRGYSIEDLSQNASFLEVAYMVIFGELPTQAQLDKFTQDVSCHTLLHEDLRRIYDAFPRNAHPMATLSSVVCSLSTFYQDALEPQNPEHAYIEIVRLLAKLPTIAAYSYKKLIGQPLIYPQNHLSYTANFLNMMFSVPSQPYELDPDIPKLLDELMVLHVDHEQNCSTATVRMVGSSHANLYASISAGICALWGPLHGGANQAVMEMLQRIYDDGGDVQKYVKMAKDRTNSFRLMGFGHRVYKNYDPRAKIIKARAKAVLDKLGIEDPLLDIARELEAVALKDDYFVERKLYPNVDFYSGIIYRALGFPLNMFPVMFAIGRLPGWISQWKEMMETSSRIARPRQIYTGPNKRPFVPIHKR